MIRTNSLKAAGLGVCLGMLLAAPSPAAFEVRACGAASAGAISAWTLIPLSGAMSQPESFVVCPPTGSVDPNGSVSQGFGVTDELGGPDIAVGAGREWRLDAPDGARIVGFAVTRDIGNRLGEGTLELTPYARTASGDISGETCFRPAGQPYCRIQGQRTIAGLDTSFIAWGIRCDNGGSFCNQGSSLHEVWVSIQSAVVTIDDFTPPTFEAAPAGPLFDGAWQNGVRGFTVDGADSTGIRRVTLMRVVGPGDVQPARAPYEAPVAAAGGCRDLNQGVAYTYVDPCGGSRGLSAPQSLSVDTAGLPEGTGRYRVWITDTGGNHAESGDLSVAVDRTAPQAPVVAADGAWSSAAAGTWSWTVPAETDRAPIVAVEVEQCDGRGCVTEDLGPQGFGAQMELTREVPEGESGVRVRLRDAAGNQGSWSEIRNLYRDRSAPVVTLQTQQDGGRIQPVVQAGDGLSGVAAVELEYRVNGGAWVPLAGTVEGREGDVFRFRARATDRAGNVSGWVESQDLTVPRNQVVGPGATGGGGGGTGNRPPAKLLTRVTGVTSRWVGRRLVVRGRVAPASATGVVRVRAGRVVRAARLRGGRFVIRVIVPRRSSRFAISYAGDARHAAAPARRLRIPRRR